MTRERKFSIFWQERMTAHEGGCKAMLAEGKNRRVDDSGGQGGLSEDDRRGNNKKKKKGRFFLGEASSCLRKTRERKLP